MAVIETASGYTRDGHMVEFVLADGNVVWTIICPVKSLEPGVEFEDAPWCHRSIDPDDPEVKDVSGECLFVEHVINESLTLGGYAYASALEDYIGPEVNTEFVINGRMEVGIRWNEGGYPEWVPWEVLT